MLGFTCLDGKDRNEMSHGLRYGRSSLLQEVKVEKERVSIVSELKGTFQVVLNQTWPFHLSVKSIFDHPVDFI